MSHEVSQLIFPLPPWHSWVNFRERFTRNGVNCFPHEVWVGDKHALKIAKEEIPEVTIMYLIEDKYFQDIKEELKKYSKPFVPQ